MNSLHIVEDSDIFIMSSCGPSDDTVYKVSYHILVCPDKFVVSNAKENEEFARTLSPEKW